MCQSHQTRCHCVRSMSQVGARLRKRPGWGFAVPPATCPHLYMSTQHELEQPRITKSGIKEVWCPCSCILRCSIQLNYVLPGPDSQEVDFMNTYGDLCLRVLDACLVLVQFVVSHRLTDYSECGPCFTDCYDPCAPTYAFGKSVSAEGAGRHLNDAQSLGQARSSPASKHPGARTAPVEKGQAGSDCVRLGRKRHAAPGLQRPDPWKRLFQGGAIPPLLSSFFIIINSTAEASGRARTATTKLLYRAEQSEVCGT